MNSPGVCVTIAPQSNAAQQVSVQDVLDRLAYENQQERETQWRRRAARTYSPEETQFLGKLKGGATPRDRAIKQLKEMMGKDLKLVLLNFINEHKTPLLQRQIDAATEQVTRTYNEALAQLGYDVSLNARVET